MINVVSIEEVYLSGDKETLITDLAAAIRDVRMRLTRKLGREKADKSIREAIYMGMHAPIASSLDELKFSPDEFVTPEMIALIVDNLLEAAFGNNKGEEK